MSYDLRPRAGERHSGVAMTHPQEFSRLSDEELTASQAVVLLQSTAEAEGRRTKDAVPLKSTETQSDIIAESFSEGDGQSRPHILKV